MRVIDNLETSDDYVAGLTIEQEDATSLLFVVANASVRARLRPTRRETGGDESYGDELLFTPQATTITGISGAKFRSAVAGTPARVVAVLAAPDEPQLVAGVPFLQQLAASGATSGGGSGGVSGDIVWSGASSRDGSVLCDGTHYNSVADPTFANLFAAIGIAFGGTGANDFGVPDLRGRSPVGVGTHTDVNALGKADALALAARTPKHAHTVVTDGSLFAAGGFASTQTPATTSLAEAGWLALNPFIVK